MASRWGTSWGTAWGASWDIAEIPQPTIIIVGGDDAPGADYRRKKKRKDEHELFREVEQTIHALLHPAVEAGPVESVAEAEVRGAAAERARRQVDELTVLAQGQHDLLQRVAALRAELANIEEVSRANRLLEQDEEDALIWMF